MRSEAAAVCIKLLTMRKNEERHDYLAVSEPLSTEPRILVVEPERRLLAVHIT